METISKIRDTICEGCISANANDDGYGCGIIEPFNDRGETCPCLNCLLKMMCHDSCLEFRNYCRL